MFNLDNEPKRDEMAEEEEKPTPRKRSRSKQKSKRATKSEGVSDEIATSEPEVKPEETLELKEDIPDLESLAEALGSGTIPPVSEPELVGDVERVIVRSAWPSRLIVANSPSGEIYDFERAGAILSVNAADVHHLLSHNRTNARGCCGSGHNRIKFELA